MKVFSVVNGMVFEGATMHEATLASGVKIPAIEVGSDVPKKKGILPIIDGKPEEKVFHVKLECSSPRFAKVRMIEEDDGDRTGALVVLRTTCGKGGSASHNGDYLGWTCGGIHPECENSIPYRTENPNLPIFQNEDFLKDCPICGAKLFPLWGKFVSTFKIMVAGTYIDPDSRTGGNFQYIGVLPTGKTIRSAYSGNLHGLPFQHILLYENGDLKSFTLNEYVEHLKQMLPTMEYCIVHQEPAKEASLTAK